MFELLESRLLCSVGARVVDGVLIVRGGSGDDTVSIYRGADFTTFSFFGSTEGEIIAQQVLSYSGVTRGVRIDLGGGNDTVTLHGARVFGSIVIDGGGGNDQLIVRSSRPTGNLVWRGGNGDDSVLIRKSTIQGNLLLDGGAGRDRTELSFLHARGTVRIDDTDGPGIITLTRLSVDGNARIATGASADALTIHDSTFKRDATIATSRGDDAIRVRGTVFRRTPIIDAGAGENDVDREVILSWDFNNGSQGWEAGFSDYPAGQIVGTKPDGTPWLAEDAYDLTSGIESLPGELGSAGEAFVLSGRNLSDDLFMYLTKRLTPADGTTPGGRYIVTFRLTYATNVPTSAQYLGLFVGGSTRMPKRLPDESTAPGLIIHRLYADNDVRVNSQQNGTYVGTLDNELRPATEDWRSVHREGRNYQPVIADSAGGLSLYAGVDSSFEVVSTAFVQSLSVRLTPA